MYICLARRYTPSPSGSAPSFTMTVIDMVQMDTSGFLAWLKKKLSRKKVPKFEIPRSDSDLSDNSFDAFSELPGAEGVPDIGPPVPRRSTIVYDLGFGGMDEMKPGGVPSSVWKGTRLGRKLLKGSPAGQQIALPFRHNEQVVVKRESDENEWHGTITEITYGMVDDDGYPHIVDCKIVNNSTGEVVRYRTGMQTAIQEIQKITPDFANVVNEGVGRAKRRNERLELMRRIGAEAAARLEAQQNANANPYYAYGNQGGAPAPP